MTDTTDIKALRESAESIMNLLENLAGYEPQDIDMDSVELRFEDENGFDTGCDISIVDTAKQSADIIRTLLDQLEAERQRADDCNKSAEYSAATNKSVVAANCRLQEELAALKGEQVPVGIVRKVQQGLHVTLYQSIPEGTELFTTQQKPVVPVGFLFVVKATGAVIYSIADAAIEGTQLIGQICGDVAIEATGGIVKEAK